MLVLESNRIESNRNRIVIEATVKECHLGSERLEVFRTQIQAVADCRDAEYDMSAK